MLPNENPTKTKKSRKPARKDTSDASIHFAFLCLAARNPPATVPSNEHTAATIAKIPPAEPRCTQLNFRPKSPITSKATQSHAAATEADAILSNPVFFGATTCLMTCVHLKGATDVEFRTSVTDGASEFEFFALKSASNARAYFCPTLPNKRCAAPTIVNATVDAKKHTRPTLNQFAIRPSRLARNARDSHAPRHQDRELRQHLQHRSRSNRRRVSPD